ncbi:hypothetical protein GI374_01450 [Paracoccus sp. S-4012]|nr:hypothetical protein [Paracoccus sp. S-4012]MRX49123.1 hypothetical protein [Paracoccus sp. S-4012]
MKALTLALSLTLGLAACGVDGPPVTPAAAGVTFGGDAYVGVRGEL